MVSTTDLALSPPAGAGAAGLDEVERLTVADYEEVLADHRRLTRELDVAMHGEEGAAKQASLCDLIEPALSLRRERDEARTTLARQAADLERLRAAEGPAPVRAMVVAYAHSACSAAAYPNMSIERRWLRDRWLAALDALAMTEDQARAECRTAMRGIYTAPALAPDRGSEVRPEGGGEGGASDA